MRRLTHLILVLLLAACARMGPYRRPATRSPLLLCVRTAVALLTWTRIFAHRSHAMPRKGLGLCGFSSTAARARACRSS